MKWPWQHDDNPGNIAILGPVLYVAGMQYFAVQFLVSLRWPKPYSLSRDTISDLGNTSCGTWNGRYVCSPLHDLMNGSFIVLGVTMLLGSLLMFRRYGKGRIAAAGFTAMGLSGLGVVIVGIFPENSVSALHGLGSVLPFTLGNAALTAMALSLAMPPLLRLCVSLSGVAALLALTAYASSHYLGFGEGGIERAVAYPQTICLAVIGCYLIAVPQSGRSRTARTSPETIAPPGSRCPDHQDPAPHAGPASLVRLWIQRDQPRAQNRLIRTRIRPAWNFTTSVPNGGSVRVTSADVRMGYRGQGSIDPFGDRRKLGAPQDRQ